MKPFVVGLSYKTTPVELRERLAVAPAKVRCAGCRLRLMGELAEVVVLSTCNRVEVYGVAGRPREDLASLFHHVAPRAPDCRPYLYVREGREAAEHLFSVASGLDSMVLGETEITGQVKQAYETAREGRLTGRVLNRMFQTALQTAKEIRAQTQIGRGATSVGSVAVELAERVFGGQLGEQSVMILGAGRMGEACVRHLAKRGVRTIMVANRSWDRGRELAELFGGQAIRFESCLEAMAGVDIVVSSTGAAGTILRRADLERVMRARSRPLVLIDIAVPRDIDPEVQLLEGVYLYNIDQLEEVVRENVGMRERELERCSLVVRDRAAGVMAKLAGRQGEARPGEPRPHSEGAWLSAPACAG